MWRPWNAISGLIHTIWKFTIEVFENRINTFNPQKFFLLFSSDLIAWFYSGSKRKDMKFWSEQECVTEIKDLLFKKHKCTVLWHKMQNIMSEMLYAKCWNTMLKA